MGKLLEDSALDLEVICTTLELILDMNLEDQVLCQCLHQLQDHGHHLFLYQYQEVGVLLLLLQDGLPLLHPQAGLLQVCLELLIPQQLHLTLFHLAMVQCLLLQAIQLQLLRAMELQLLQAIQLQVLLFLQAHFNHQDLFLLQHLLMQSLIMVDIMDTLTMFNSQNMQDRIITIQFILMIIAHILKEGQTLD